MSLSLRPFQRRIEADVYQAWNQGAINVCPVAATGSGKTVLFSKFLGDCDGIGMAIAHRQELVSQMSVTLARNGVRHNIIAPDNVRKMIVSLQIAEVGTSYFDRNARVHCAGVDTLIRTPAENWHKQVRLQVQDEAHHVLKANKWGQAAQMFPNAYGLFPTATPSRADGKGLGRHADGLIDKLVLAPSMREIINMGYLTDYRIICDESDINIASVPISDTTGDFNATRLRDAVHQSKRIVGDVVGSYLKWAKGKLGITFAVDVAESIKIAQAFRDAGVPAEAVSAKTPDNLRAAIIRRFKNREILQLVNVDLFGEGFDLPALEVVQFARHTNSFSLYSQMFGRALRLMLEAHIAARWDSFSDAERRALIAQSIKPKAIIIDHVGNVVRHLGPPDAAFRHASWTLDRRESRGASKKNDAIPVRTCLNPACLAPYERIEKCCPFCGHYPEPAGRTLPIHVEGDLTELDEAALARLRGEITAAIENGPTIPYGASPEVVGRLKRVHWEKQQTVYRLKNAVAWWAGLQNAQGRNDSQSYRLFYHKFGIDVMGMELLPRKEAEELFGRVAIELAKHGIDANANAELHLLKH